MTVQLLQALVLILETCLEQDACSKCPMREFCDKMPCEW